MPGVVIECTGQLTFLFGIEFNLATIFALLFLGVGYGLVEFVIDQPVLLKTRPIGSHYLIA